MLSKTQFPALIILLLVCSVLFYQYMGQSSLTIENFWGLPNMTVKVDATNHNGTQSLPGNNQSQLMPPVYNVPGQFQPPLAPRFSNTQYGAYITYNLPEEKNLAVMPNNPMMLANAIEAPHLKESFDYPPESSSSDYLKDSKILTESGADNTNQLPVQTMSNTTGASPDGPQGSDIPYTYDRFIYALQRSRLAGLGDPIRGDLAIVPCLPDSRPDSGKWFLPSVQPSIDLRAGALAVMGGVSNQTAYNTAQLQMQDTGGTINTFQGVAWQPPRTSAIGQAITRENAINMASQKTLGTTMGPPYGDVQATAFP